LEAEAPEEAPEEASVKLKKATQEQCSKVTTEKQIK